MAQIISYKDFNDIEFSNRPDEFKELLIVYAATNHPFPSRVFAPAVSHSAVRANSWGMLSKALNDYIQRKKHAQAELREITVARAPQARYNYFPNEDSIYNDSLNILLEHVRLPDLGLNEASSPEEIKAAIDRQVQVVDRGQQVLTNLHAGLKEFLQQPRSERLFTLHYPATGHTFATDNLPALVKEQLKTESERDYDTVLVLDGDGEVKSFIQDQGKTLLKKIALNRDLPKDQWQIYCKKIVRTVEDIVSMNKKQYPQAYKVFYNTVDSNRHR